MQGSHQQQGANEQQHAEACQPGSTSMKAVRGQHAMRAEKSDYVLV
jgi:hypothetical protein